ncbi:MAG: type II toxin-antitoxin system HicB family antitoxin [Bacillota bacterium]|nr:type II toxin-antitoxin system HicB family antitoxin [Bacillota bacterium]
MENIIYPAIIGRDEDGNYIRFDDENLIPVYGDTVEEAVIEAQEVLSLEIIDYEENGKKFIIPEAETALLQEGESIIYLNLWMPYHRSKVETIYKKKTLTIPTWLDLLAQQKKINFSNVLVKGLKEELGIQ